ncbi:MAG: hypothetical protein QOG70_3824 [Solirubrobacteraceae bacterium]|jgi:hypothetical protein|nr:hypothetical protein [Solirubrobacteraceae bacterium]
MGASAHLRRLAIVAIAGLAAGVPGVAAAADSATGGHPDAAPASVAPAPDPAPRPDRAPVARPVAAARVAPVHATPTLVRPRVVSVPRRSAARPHRHRGAVSAPPSFPSFVPAVTVRASGGDDAAQARRLAIGGLSLLALALASAGLVAVAARGRVLR